MRILVLGSGMVGRVITLDLAARHDVTASDLSEEALQPLADHGIQTRVVDVADTSSLTQVVEGFDLVVGAVPGHLGFQTLGAVIDAGIDVVDISFCPEDPLELQQRAVDRNVVVIVDAGVAPGLDNLILGHHDRFMDVKSFECLVGGLPTRRKWPFDYKAPFSPIDVIEEYTRPARYVEAGSVVTREALSDPVREWFSPVGTLVSFNTDGLRTLISTMSHIPNMKEKTLRYPGHIEIVAALRETGFFSDQPITVGKQTIRPIDVSSRLLFNEWKLGDDEPEFTVMRVSVRGVDDGQDVTYTYDLYDERDPSTGFSSMARTTGFTCTAMVEELLSHRPAVPGVYPLELIGRAPGGFGRAAGHLAERGVLLDLTKSPS